MNTSSSLDMLFIVTVWVQVAAVMGKPAGKTISHQRAFGALEHTMDYIKGLDNKSTAEVATVTHAEFFRDYSDLVRAARTAGLIQCGVATDHTDAYMIPDGVAAAASSYKRLAHACGALVSASKARGKRAELESIHDRARRMEGLLSDLS